MVVYYLYTSHILRNLVLPCAVSCQSMYTSYILCVTLELLCAVSVTSQCVLAFSLHNMRMHRFSDNVRFFVVSLIGSYKQHNGKICTDKKYSGKTSIRKQQNG